MRRCARNTEATAFPHAQSVDNGPGSEHPASLLYQVGTTVIYVVLVSLVAWHQYFDFAVGNTYTIHSTIIHVT